MKQNQKLVLEWMGASEGGYVNHPRDPGGATNHGVTQATLNAWRKAKGLGKQDVKVLTKKDASSIFVHNYLRPVWFDQLPAGLDYAMADYSVNSGPARAIKALQRIVKTKVDGVLGVNSMAAINQRNAAGLITLLCEERFAFMKRLKHWPTFKGGWTTRVMGKHLGAQTDDIGVIDRGIKLAQAQSNIPVPKPTEGKAIPQGGVGELLKAIIAVILGVLK